MPLPSCPIICMVTDRKRLAAPHDGRLVSLARHAAAAGTSIIQVREPDLEGRALLDLTRRIVDAVRPWGTRVLVNDRVDVALASGAHGVHLKGGSCPASRVLAIAPPGFIVSRSVHSVEEAVAAEQDGAHIVVMGTIHPTESKREPVELAGLHGLAHVCRSVQIPVLAIGGIDADKLAGVAAAGAAGFAAIELFAGRFGADDGDAGVELLRVLEHARRAFQWGPLVR